MENLVEVQVLYKYYSKERITPLFIENNELLSLSYEEFYCRLLREVQHLRKLSTSSDSLRLIIVKGESEIDISPKYFKSQMTKLIDRGSKTVVVRVAANESPLSLNSNATANSRCETSSTLSSGESKSKRRLDLTQNQQTETIRSVHVCDPGQDDNNAVICKSQHVVLPLERHARRYQQIVEDISDQLASKNQELEVLDKKLSAASSQNSGHLTVCGSCHLRTGHTRKGCQFSPCRSAFSCGILAKHNDQKSLRASIAKEVSSLNSKLLKAQTDLDSATTTMERMRNCSAKRIEDIIVNEKPNRYTSPCGRKNWLLLNKDVAILQSQLKGKMATRTNIMNQLETITKARKTPEGTDHRVTSQKKCLEDEYAIRFPVAKRHRNVESTELDLPSGQEKDDFCLALQLQQQEMENESAQLASCPRGDINDNNNEELQIEADAAAALLHLKNRKSL